MSMWELVLVALSLAMDAFAVAVAKGPCLTSRDDLKRVGMPLLFGIFQMAMPLIGWVIGAQLADKINEGLKKLQENGTFAEISEKWFGEDVSPE